MRIAIAGYGLEGESNYHYYASNLDNQILIADENQPSRELPIDVDTIIGPEAFSHLDGFDIVMRTASLPPRKITTDGQLWSSTNEFFAKCPCQIIGVTGTKGKGTISSLIASILKADSRKVWLVGNIGVTPLQFLSEIKPDDIVVYELSSFQLWDLKKSPHIAVVTMVEPEHLNVHYDFEDYIEAKANIRRFQTADDFCIFHPSNKISERISKVSNLGTVVQYGVKGNGAYVSYGKFYFKDEIVCDKDKLQLFGEHNVENACAAITVAKICNVSNEIIAKGLENFKGLEHRLEFVRELDGVRYFNDCFSSSTPATVAAIKAFKVPEILIMGGIDRGGDFSGIADLIATQGNVKRVIVIGAIREKLSGILKSVNPTAIIETIDLKDMKSIIMLAKSYATTGDIVLMSPGCASFDMFKDFYDRGNQFKKAVKEL